MDSFDIFLYLAYTLVIVAAVAAILLPLISSIGNPQSLLKSGLGILAIIACYFLAYALSGSEVTLEYSKFDVGPELSKIVGGTLIMAYLLLGGAILGIVFTEFSKIIK
jgi:type III secretory pathway component EscS